MTCERVNTGSLDLKTIIIIGVSMCPLLLDSGFGIRGWSLRSHRWLFS